VKPPSAITINEVIAQLEGQSLDDLQKMVEEL
jgi:hypothetical protein